MKKITIAIDGYSSTGKSTLAKELAKQLGYVYIDTGAMYRAITLYALQQHIISDNHFEEEVLVKSLENITLQFVFNPQIGYSEMYLNHINVEKDIRTLQVSNYVSKIAEISAVRTFLVEKQQAYGKDKAVVMDGRDIGTVVFPNAELKIFMSASPEIRANRRYKELVNLGQKVSYEEVYENVLKRDKIDTTREDSPLIKAKDAIEIDNSQMSKDQQFEKVYQLAIEKINQ